MRQSTGPLEEFWSACSCGSYLELVHFLVEALCLTATCSESVYCRVEHGILVFWEMTSRDPLG